MLIKNTCFISFIVKTFHIRNSRENANYYCFFLMIVRDSAYHFYGATTINRLPFSHYYCSFILMFMIFFFQATHSPAGTGYEPAEMTEVVDMLVPDHRVATVRHYEAGPPPGLELVSTVLFAFVFTHLREGRGNKRSDQHYYAESKHSAREKSNG